MRGLARLGDKPVAEVAKSLGISESCLRNWIAQADVDDDGSSMSVTSAAKKELADDDVPVAVACRVLHVSTSGYYDWLDRLESPRELRDRELTKIITEIHAESRGTYGWPRVHADYTLLLWCFLSMLANWRSGLSGRDFLEIPNPARLVFAAAVATIRRYPAHSSSMTPRVRPHAPGPQSCSPRCLRPPAVCWPC